MTKAPLPTIQGGYDVRVHVTTGCGCFPGHYVMMVNHNAEVPLKVKQGDKVGSGQGLYTVGPGQTWRYDFGWLDHRPQVLSTLESTSYEFSDGRDANVGYDVPLMIRVGLRTVGHGGRVSIQ